MLEINDIKPIMYFLILIAIVFGLIGFVIGSEKDCDKEEYNILRAISSALFIGTRTEGNLFIKDNEVYKLPTSNTYAYITGYNTLPYQTDSTPCISASGDDICGRNDVVACPRYIPLGTWVEIAGKTYQCLDRLSEKYDDRFDICFDKDVESARNWGIQYLEVIIYE
jgi:3D (Asp-Asp-Asp) domain-containing protein